MPRHKSSRRLFSVSQLRRAATIPTMKTPASAKRAATACGAFQPTSRALFTSTGAKPRNKYPSSIVRGPWRHGTGGLDIEVGGMVPHGATANRSGAAQKPASPSESAQQPVWQVFTARCTETATSLCEKPPPPHEIVDCASLSSAKK